MNFLFKNDRESVSNTSELDKHNMKTDDARSKNTRKLADARGKYKYNYTHIPSIAMLDKLPWKEYPSMAWLSLVAEEVINTIINTLITVIDTAIAKWRNRKLPRKNLTTRTQPSNAKHLNYADKQTIPNILINAIRFLILEAITKPAIVPILKIIGLSIFGNFLNWILKLIFKAHPKSDPKKDVASLQEYNELFTEIQLPEIANYFEEDEVFAYMRVAGYNPLTIERVDKLEDKFPVTEAQYQEVMGNDDSLVAAGEEGRLYLADYKILSGATNGTFPETQKYSYAPLALFAVPKNSDSLMRPVAIQCAQNPLDAPIVTPKSDGYAWLFAKTIVQIADANFQEALSHLGRTHLFVGRFAIAIHRQLPDCHPLSLLLCPHFQGTLNINNLAQKSLIAPGGDVDKLLSSTIDTVRALVEADLQNYSFNEAMLPKQLEKRGVDDTEKLPVYPYRDDALLIWNGIHQWVSDYLNIHYKSDEDVQNDTYLQNWATEAVAYDGARVYDFGEKYGRIETLNYLIDATTLIIFTCSAQHAAVNFPQKGIMSYAPAAPLAGYQPVSILKGEVTEQDYLNLLPPLKQAEEQLNILQLLGSVYYTKLGYYSDNYFSESSVKTALEKFQANLLDIEKTIVQRNYNRPKYEYLLPSKIPQSINI
ncbi:MAG: lipoxygenase family protein [Rivularia sp. (in: cyanobacteria)]